MTEIQLKPPTGAPTTPVANTDNQQIVVDGGGHFFELSKAGKLFFQDSDSVTLAAANTTKSAIGTAKFINGFYNPSTTKWAVIQRAIVAVVSGTPTGPFVYNMSVPGQASGVSSASTGTIRSAMVGIANSAMLPQTGVVIACTPAITTALVQVGVVGGPAAIAAGAGNYHALDPLESAIMVPPGCFFGIMQVGASTAIVQSTMWWSEHTATSLAA